MNSITYKGERYVEAGANVKLKVPRKGAKVRLPSGAVGKFVGVISPKSHGGQKEMALVLLPGDVPGKSSHSCDLEDLVVIGQGNPKYADMRTITYKGTLYKLAEAKLPISYTEDDTTAVDKVVAEFVSGVVSVLKPGEKPAKDFGKALSYVLEQIEMKLKNDPAISVVDMGSLPKGLRK